MGIQLSDIENQLPDEDITDYRSLNHKLFNSLDKTCIVVDDDPTGNQTVYDIPLLTKWDVETLKEEFHKRTPTFFILTNSRSLSEEKSTEIFKTISRNILEASKAVNREFMMISRSDSTLRGHFSEIEVINSSLGSKDSITFIIPVMFEGKRVTVNNTHYISEEDQLTPVNETPFASDHTFGYKNADLTKYIEEKSNGKIKASSVFTLSVKDIREKTAEILSEKIKTIKSGTFCIANALNYADLDKVTNALLLAESQGKDITYRTSSSFVPSYIGLKHKGLLDPKSLINFGKNFGGLTIVGSYVPKSSKQLTEALKNFSKKNIIEVSVAKILKETGSNYIESLSKTINQQLSQGHDIIVFTSRELVTGNDSNANIDIASKVSQALVKLVELLVEEPKYLLAKGGITSNDLAIKGLGMKRATVIGQIESGIPVWKMGKETKFPFMHYMVFPGNVGDGHTLSNIIQKLN